MKVDFTKILLVLIAAGCCCIGAYSLFFKENSGSKEEGEVLIGKGKQIETVKGKRKTRLSVRKERISGKVEKPRLLESLDDEESVKLNEFSRKIIADLQAALDAENFRLVQKLVAKMLETPPDPKFGKEGVAALLRRKAVDAMGWFGAKGLPELVGLLADADPEIAQASFDQFTLALEDISLSDYERADIISMAAKVLTDVDNLEMLFMEINNMRHSVGAGLLVDICQNGTEAAKTLMPDQMEFFTGEDNIVSVEDVEKWLAENPDGPDDDDLYGGDKEE